MTSLQEKRGGGQVSTLSHLPTPTAAAAIKDVSPETSLYIIVDALSRDHLLPTEWSLPQEVFDKIIAWRGPVEVDLMATIYNRKVESFVSPFPHPAAAAIDVLTVDWNRWNQVYVFPPKTFMTLLLPKLHSYQNHGAFVVPCLPAAPWFPTLFKRAEDHLHLRVQLEQFVRSERPISGFQNYERWTAFTFWRKYTQLPEVPRWPSPWSTPSDNPPSIKPRQPGGHLRNGSQITLQCSERDTF